MKVGISLKEEFFGDKFYEIFGIQGDDDRKSWASFQVRLSKAPEQVLR